MSRMVVFSLAIAEASGKPAHDGHRTRCQHKGLKEQHWIASAGGMGQRAATLSRFAPGFRFSVRRPKFHSPHLLGTLMSFVTPGYPHMGNGMGHTTKLQDWLAVARRGSADVRNELIEHTCERLRGLTHKMLRAYPKVRRWSETDDVLQNAMLRLHRSLAEVTPKSPAEFYGLAAIQIRRELLDMARHYYGAEGQGAHHHTDGGRAADVKPAEPCEPETLERWTEFHEQVDRLPEEQQVVVGLLWYEGLSQPDAAAVLEISLATLKRRWQAARLALFEKLKESWC